MGTSGEQTPQRTSGRPRGQDSTREAILQAARTAFATSGYNGASVRGIAVAAGVDASTAIHFFGTKAGLFRAVIEEVLPATRPFAEAVARGASGRELAVQYLSLWEDPVVGPSALALVRTAISSDDAAQILKSALLGDIIDSAPGSGTLAAELSLAHLIGVAIGRHITRLPELARAEISEIADVVGPVLDRYRQA